MLGRSAVSGAFSSKGPVPERSRTPGGGDTRDTVTRLPVATRSLASTATTVVRPGATVIESGIASGGCGGPGETIETRAVPVDVAPRESAIVYVNSSVPSLPGYAVYSMELAPILATRPYAGAESRPRMVTASPSGSTP